MTGMVCFNHSSAGQSLEEISYVEEIYQQAHLQMYHLETMYLFIFIRHPIHTSVWGFHTNDITNPMFYKPHLADTQMHKLNTSKM